MLKLTIAAILLLLLAAGIFWRRMVGGNLKTGPLKDLPLREFRPPVSTEAAPLEAVDTDRSELLVVFLTSDAGWLGFNSGLPQALRDRGYPTVAWNSLRYYLKKRTPEEAAADLSRVVDHYSHAWKTKRLALIGYSWGAGVLPFLVNRLNDEQKDMLAAAAYLAYPGVADFHFKPRAWFLVLGDSAVSATDAVAEMPKVPSICIAGDGDPIRDCRSIKPFGVERVLLSANHSLTASLDEVVPHLERILEPAIGER